MAPRNETREAANSSDEPQPERGHATLATLRYERKNHYMLMDFMILDQLMFVYSIGVKAMVDKVSAPLCLSLLGLQLKNITRGIMAPTFCVFWMALLSLNANYPSNLLLNCSRTVTSAKQRFSPSKPAKASQHSTSTIKSSTNVSMNGSRPTASTYPRKSNGHCLRSRKGRTDRGQIIIHRARTSRIRSR